MRDPRALTRGRTRGAARLHRPRELGAVPLAGDGDEAATCRARLGAQLGLHRLDANWLADEDGVSRIAVSQAHDGRGGFIPYTDRAIRWHTDGYYHPASAASAA